MEERGGEVHTSTENSDQIMNVGISLLLYLLFQRPRTEATLVNYKVV